MWLLVATLVSVIVIVAVLYAWRWRSERQKIQRSSALLAHGESVERTGVARSVNELNITDWHLTGKSAPLPQHKFKLEIKWTDSSGNKHAHSGTYHFPDDIVDMPMAMQKRFAEDMTVAVVRIVLGIDGVGYS